MPVAVTVLPLWVTVALYGLPETTVWPALNVQLTVQLLIVKEALLVTVTVAPKSGGLLDGVCQATVKVALHAAPVSAGAAGAVTSTPVTVAATVSTKAVMAARMRLGGLDMLAPCGVAGGQAALPV
jgi:hypothetical protein